MVGVVVIGGASANDGIVFFIHSRVPTTGTRPLIMVPPNRPVRSGGDGSRCRCCRCGRGRSGSGGVGLV